MEEGGCKVGMHCLGGSCGRGGLIKKEEGTKSEEDESSPVSQAPAADILRAGRAAPAHQNFALRDADKMMMLS